jgi:hypothetical protein
MTTLLQETLTLPLMRGWLVPDCMITSVLRFGVTPQVQLEGKSQAVLFVPSQVTPNFNVRVPLVTGVPPVQTHLYLYPYIVEGAFAIVSVFVVAPE